MFASSTFGYLDWLAGEDDDCLAMGSLPRDQAEQQTLLDYSSHPSVLGKQLRLRSLYICSPSRHHRGIMTYLGYGCKHTCIEL